MISKQELVNQLADLHVKQREFAQRVATELATLDADFEKLSTAICEYVTQHADSEGGNVVQQSAQVHLFSPLRPVRAKTKKVRAQ